MGWEEQAFRNEVKSPAEKNPVGTCTRQYSLHFEFLVNCCRVLKGIHGRFTLMFRIALISDNLPLMFAAVFDSHQLCMEFF